MIVIFIVAVLLCCGLCFVLPRSYKAGLLMAYYMLFTLVEIPELFNQFHVLLLLCITISEYKIWPVYFKMLKDRHVIVFLSLLLLSALTTVIFSPLLRDSHSIIYFFLYEWGYKYLYFIYGILLMTGVRSLEPSLRIAIPALYIMTAFAILNYIMGYSLPVQELYTGDIDGYDFERAVRFRVQSTFINPFDFGFVCLINLLFHSFCYRKGDESIRDFIISIICCLFGIFTCHCRTILFCLLAGGLVYFFTSFKLNKKNVIGFFSAIGLGFLSFLAVPSIRKSVIGIFSIFSTNSVVVGSSLSDRAVQLLSVFYHIKDNVLFGCGYNYFNIELGWEYGPNNSSDMDLLGLEGVYLNLLLERGVWGLVLYIALISVLVYALRKYRKYSRSLYSLGITSLFLYVLFSCMTGELNSAIPSLLMIGFSYGNLRYLSILDKRKSK